MMSLYRCSMCRGSSGRHRWHAGHEQTAAEGIIERGGCRHADGIETSHTNGGECRATSETRDDLVGCTVHLHASLVTCESPLPDAPAATASIQEAPTLHLDCLFALLCCFVLLLFCSIHHHVALLRLVLLAGLLTRPIVLPSLSLAHNTIDCACLPFFTRVDTHYDTPRLAT